MNTSVGKSVVKGSLSAIYPSSKMPYLEKKEVFGNHFCNTINIYSFILYVSNSKEITQVS